MKTRYIIFLVLALPVAAFCQQATVIPNAGFETWIDYGDYDNPQFWDTPNEETSAIPFFGTTVVSKSTDHQSGLYSAKLETKSITLVGEVPGVVTLGQLSIDIANFTYTINGGAPVNDMPTHLKGFYKFSPKGGDSCAIGIGLMRWNGASRDSIGYGVFSTKDTVPDWTPFSAWIDYDTMIQPDTMNILAISSAQEVMNAGTTLWVDELWLDYTVGYDEQDPSAGIDVYDDRQTRRLIVFLDFTAPQETMICLYGMRGENVYSSFRGELAKGKVEIPYSDLSRGIYILEVVHNDLRFTRKYLLNF